MAYTYYEAENEGWHWGAPPRPPEVMRIRDMPLFRPWPSWLERVTRDIPRALHIFEHQDGRTMEVSDALLFDVRNEDEVRQLEDVIAENLGMPLVHNARFDPVIMQQKQVRFGEHYGHNALTLRRIAYLVDGPLADTELKVEELTGRLVHEGAAYELLEEKNGRGEYLYVRD